MADPKIVHAYLIKVGYWTEDNGYATEWLVQELDQPALNDESIRGMLKAADETIGVCCELEQFNYLGMRYAEEDDNA